MHASRSAVARLIDLALPGVCVGCGAEGDVVCTACRPALEVRRDEPAGVPIGLPIELPAPLLQLEWCAPFSGTVRAALHGLKYGGERRLAEPLGRALARRWRQAGQGADLLVPVPIHAERRRQRGYDQAESIAAVAARALRLPIALALERTRATRPQFELGHGNRAANVAGAFGLRVPRSAVRGRWILLIDDVVTTGATLGACGEVLMAAGAAAVSAATVARER